MRQLIYILLLFISFSLPLIIYSQQPKTADEYFNNQNYKEAIKLYLKEYQKNKNDIDINYKIAQCYLNSHLAKKNAVPYLEFITSQPKFAHEIWFEMGKAYQYANSFDKAIEAYNKFKEKAKGPDIEKVNRAIETCINAKELTKKPLDVTFINLGKNVNSDGADYYPFCPANESFLVFTTRRKAAGTILEFDGYYSSDIYISEVVNGEFQKAKSVGPNINTPENEQCVGLTPNGKTMIIYIEHSEAVGDLYLSHQDKNGFGRTEVFPLPVNSKYLESSGSVDADEQILIFASNKPGGYGGLDLYISRKLPGNVWSEPQNLGPTINTPYDEDFPQLTTDGKTLYFSSKGHKSIGGFDIFKSTYNPSTNEWTSPQNIGFPINTTDDDMRFAPGRSPHEGYISAVRDEGFGDYDIYRVIINSEEAPLTAITGSVFLNDSTKPYPTNLDISIIDVSSGQNYPGDFKYLAAKKKFVLALPAGKYKIVIEAPDCERYTQTISILDKVDYKTHIEQNFILKSLTNNKTELNNSNLPKVNNKNSIPPKK